MFMIFKISISTEWLTAILLKIMNWNFPGFAIFFVLFKPLSNYFPVIHIISPSPPPFLLVGTIFRLKFWKGGDQKKMSAMEVLKSPCHRYLPGGDLLCFLSKKTLRNEIWFWGLNFQMSIFAYFTQTTHLCLALWYFGSVKPTE